MNDSKLILASGSPRRRELLERAGYQFDVNVSDADELEDGSLDPAELAMRNARTKALAVAREAGENAAVIGADTIVVLDGTVFGKPADAPDAVRMLHALSGRTHQVITGVCVVRKSERSVPTVILSERSESKNPATGRNSTQGPSTLPLRGSAQDDRGCGVTLFAEVTDVTFRDLTDDEINVYIATGEPLDKAGAYGIQGLGGALVDHIDGDFDNVVGLPVTRLQRTLDLERGNKVDDG